MTILRYTSYMRPFAMLLALVALAGDASACSVPVFRFALERWQADLYEVDVFHRGPLTAEQRAAMSALEDRSQVNGGDLNWEIVPCDIAGDLAADLQTVWDGQSDPALPFVVLRSPGGRQGSPIVWTGPLSEVSTTLAASRPEKELVRRLLSGDSVVWLVLRGTDKSQADRVTSLLTERFPTLMEEIELPAGVGLPGSELLARIPLGVRFSVLEVAADSGLRRTAVARSAKSVDEQTTLVMPVFGRGRGVQVLTAEELDADVIADLSRFLCGACSCQVKQLNPGFDLLLPVSWDERLYGDAVPVEAIAETNADEPTLVAIPAGDQPAAKVTSMEARPATAADEAANRAAAQSETTPSPVQVKNDWYLLGTCVLIVGLIYVWRRQASWSRRNAE
ncbi:MAG TPA: hypothetical protein VM165_12405 [Planctomycetaceae bacterium]|nr:hypothetical protein [Planctomycetaceae bacterium]